MKLCFLLFDMGTLGLVMLLLRHLSRPVGWSVAYGWCPLVIKEIANSGHLDAVAVFFTTLGIFWIVRHATRAANWYSLWPATALAAGIGAKLYPIILIPLLTTWLLKQHGWARALTFVTATGVLSLVFLGPMLRSDRSPSASDEPVSPETETAEVTTPDSVAGLRTFLTHWEMNDFFFLILVENLKPLKQVRSMGQEAWFSFVPDRFRIWMVDRWTSRFPVESYLVPFATARMLTLALTAAVALRLLVVGWRQDQPQAWLEAAFLTVAWFLLLSPTLNPWYWIWALPLVAFTRNPAWIWMSGLVPLYYLRFWLEYRWPTEGVAGTPYVGVQFFDFIVTWVEFFPWLIALFVIRWFGHGRDSSQLAAVSS